ncbi:MAG: hypothetical protein DIU69_05865 [Bacillota bacterium]|nr:MAG: hypothetical protein DIU69_05865 [Bacillota bacterium]
MGKLRRLVMLTLLAVLALVLAVKGGDGESRTRGPAGKELADWMGPGVLDWTTGDPAMLADWMGPGVLDREPGTSVGVARTTTT